jgi:outer membrane protein OmpA-like peptidoglycan-associated protein
MAISFDVNSARLRPEAEPFIQAIAGLLQKNAATRIQIEGHTDASGSAATNLDLSKRRAISVMQTLVGQYGIDPNRVTAIGKGSSEPLKAGDAYNPDNRRVQFQILG